MEYCARKQCQTLCTFLFAATCAFGKMCLCMKCLICIKHFFEKTSKLTNQLLTAQSFFLYVCIINLSAVTLNISSIVQKQNHNWSSNSEYTCESLGTAVDSGATVAAAAAQPTASSTGMIKNHVSLDFENTTFWSHLVTYLSPQVYIEATSADSSKGTQTQGLGENANCS